MTWRGAAAHADRRPWLVAGALTLGAFLMAHRRFEPVDLTLLADAGERLLRGRLGRVFDDPAVQAGPLTLVLLAVLRGTTRWAGSWAISLQVAALCASVSACFVAAVRMAVPRPGWVRGAATVGVGVPALLYGCLILQEAHPSHAPIALLWFLAARAAQRDRPVVVGLALGAACALDTWGILGAGVVLALPSWRSAARALLVAAALTLLCWLPFVFAGLRSFSFRWLPSPGSLPWLLYGDAPVAWTWRVLQGGLAAAAGAAVSWRLRHSPHLMWVLPAAIVAVRLPLDPLWVFYYEMPTTIMCFVGLAALLTAGVRPPLAALACVAMALFLPPVLREVVSPQLAMLGATLCLGLLAIVLVPSADYGASVPDRR